MKPPNPVTIGETVNGEPSAWKCPACSQTFDLSNYHGTLIEKREAMFAAYHKHFQGDHRYDDAGQAAVRIVRETTKS